MILGKKDLLSPPPPIASYDSSIGELKLFSISGQFRDELIEYFGGDLDSSTAVDFARKFLEFTCYPADSLGDNGLRPECPKLSKERISNLDPNELDDLARLYIDNERHLNRRLAETTKTDKNGREITSLAYAEIEYPEKEGESGTEYLFRLYKLRDKQHHEEMLKFRKALEMPAAISDNLLESVSRTFALGNHIREAMRLLDSLTSVGDAANKLRRMNDLVRPLHRMVDVPTFPSAAERIDSLSPAFENEGNEVEANLLDELASDTRKLVSFGEYALDYLVQSNETQTQMLLTTIALQDTADRSEEKAASNSWWNFWLKIVVIILAFGNLALVGVTLWLSIAITSDTRNDAKETGAAIRHLSSELSVEREFSQKATEAILTEINQGRVVRDAAFQKILDEQAAVLEKLKKAQPL